MIGEISGAPLITVGRYAVYEEIASGGMATVHFGRLVGPAGFSRTVAIKRLHPQFAKDSEFVAMFLDEARLAARISHPNVVPTLDVVASSGELLLVMQYVHGESLSRLLRTLGGPIDPALATTLMSGVLHGLHAAHTATSDRGEPLCIVHRDVSPQNVIVGIDGVPRLVDFGVAKAADRAQTTRDGQIKGKFSYMAPEQLMSEQVSARTDLFAASVVLWEALTGRRLFRGDSAGKVVSQILSGDVPAPSSIEPRVPVALDRIVLRGLAQKPEDRFASAEEMALALESVASLVTPHAVGKWVASVAEKALSDRTERIGAIEKSSSSAGDLPSEGKRAIEALRQSEAETSAPAPRSESSQLSTISVEQMPRPPARRRTLGVALTVGGLALAGLVAWRVSGGARTSAPAAATGGTVPSARGIENPASPASAPEITPASSGEIADDAPAAPSASAADLADAAPAPKTLAPGAARRPAGKKPPAGAGDDDLYSVRK